MLGESKRYVNPEVYMGNALERKVEESMVRMKACFLHNNDAIEKVIVTFFFAAMVALPPYALRKPLFACANTRF